MKLFRFRIIRPVEQLNEIGLEIFDFYPVGFHFEKGFVEGPSGFYVGWVHWDAVFLFDGLI